MKFKSPPESKVDTGGSALLTGSGKREVSAVILKSTLTCPECGHVKTETMPTDACQWFYECEQCHAVLKPKPGDCCVYCSFGTVACPPIQEKGKGSGCCE